MRNAPLSPSFLPDRSQCDPYSASAVIYNLIARSHRAVLSPGALWEGKAGRGPLLLLALRKRAAGHAVLWACDDFARVPRRNLLAASSSCFPLPRHRVFPSFPRVPLRLLHHLSQHHPQSCSPGERPQRVSSCPFLSAASGRTFVPCWACCDGQQFILKRGVTGDVVCPGALSVSLLWRAGLGRRFLGWHLVCLHVCSCLWILLVQVKV